MPSTILRADNSANIGGIKPCATAQPEQVFHYKYALYNVSLWLEILIKFYKLIWPIFCILIVYLNVSRYLKEFRVEQCPQFLQHKCQQHRPFTCFHWHFQNQKRRRPIKRKDGTFNYNADVYCNKFDETTGICSDGDE